jgi:hypothetical protein
MSNDYFKVTRQGQISAWVTAQMLKGAGYAAGAVISAALIIWAIWGISQLLPEESKQSPDPNTWSMIVLPADVTVS